MTFVKHDAGKLAMHLIDPQFVEGLAAVLTLGAAKYSPRNWVNCTEPYERYYSALQRHMLAYAKGETADPESGLSHLYHAACCLMFLAHFEREVVERNEAFAEALQQRIDQRAEEAIEAKCEDLDDDADDAEVTRVWNVPLSTPKEQYGGHTGHMPVSGYGDD